MGSVGRRQTPLVPIVAAVIAAVALVATPRIVEASEDDPVGAGAREVAEADQAARDTAEAAETGDDRAAEAATAGAGEDGEAAGADGAEGAEDAPATAEGEGESEGAESGEGEEIVVGLRMIEPFAIADDDGEHGLALALWDAIATSLDLEYRTEPPGGVDRLLDGLESGDFDVGVAPLTKTSAREQRVDFTHTFMQAGLGIAVAPEGAGGMLASLLAVLSPEFLLLIVGLIALLLTGGVLIWLLERRHNPEEFPPEKGRGLWAGFWWSAIVFTNLGGDGMPKSILARFIALVWIFGGIVLVSFFTASMASALTVDRLAAAVEGRDDLYGARVGALEGATSAEYLEEEFIPFRGFDTVEEGLDALEEDEIDAFVHDAPILRYLSHAEYGGRVRVLPETFNLQHYAFAVPNDSPLRDRLNPIILEELESERWATLLHRYLGGEE